MRYLLFFFALIAAYTTAFSQDYSAISKQAWDAYSAKDYLGSATLYNQAFRENGDKGSTSDRYNAACSWALAGEVDSSFQQMIRIAEKGGYSNLAHMTTDSDLSILHDDPRWEEVIATVTENKRIEEKDLDQELVAALDNVYKTDQSGRNRLRDTETKYGRDSDELKTLWKEINFHDSVNLITIRGILDEHGWLGKDIIGKRGNTTLFLVIQHSDIETQQEYLPMMRKAVEDGKARGSSLALLEDRVALRTGSPQIYGSQIGRSKDGSMYVQNLIDPETVNERRASVGLGPLGDYTSNWNFEWDVARHKKMVAQAKAEKEAKKMDKE
ncbi:MAG: DUF6624 domain-containing protein [Saprospiraceae bacterium]